MPSNWYVFDDGKQYGPIAGRKLKEWAAEGRITPQSKVRKGENGQWASASRVKGLFPVMPKPEEMAPSVSSPVPPSVEARTTAARLSTSGPQRSTDSFPIVILPSL